MSEIKINNVTITEGELVTILNGLFIIETKTEKAKDKAFLNALMEKLGKVAY